MQSKTQSTLKNYMSLKKRIVLDGLLVGLVAGVFSILYRIMLSYLSEVRHYLFQEFSPTRVILLVILFFVLAIFVGYLIQWSPLSSGSGIPQIQGEMLGALSMNEKKVITAKFIGGGIANLTGLSLGREGPSIQIGGAAGKLLAKLLKRDGNEERFMISAGASAGLAAAFNAPISGAIFTLEEMHKNFSPLILIPSLIAAIVADYISKKVLGLEVSFHFISLKENLPLHHYFHVVGIGIFAGFIGILFNFLILKGQDFYKKLPIPPLYRPIIPFFVSIVLGFSLYDVLGGGHHLVEKLVHHPMSLQFLLLLLVVKLLFTSLSYGSSVQGGIFLPVLVLGALSGALYLSFFEKTSLLESTYYANFIVLGMAAILTAVVRSPILSIMLVTEMVGSFSHMLAFCLVAITAYLTAEILHSKPIYESLLERLLSHSVEEESAVEEKSIMEFQLPMHASICETKLRDILLPQKVLIVSVQRGAGEFIPNGETTLQGGDNLTILCDKKDLPAVQDYFFHL